jgi:hypothetical protein
LFEAETRAEASSSDDGRARGGDAGQAQTPDAGKEHPADRIRPQQEAAVDRAITEDEAKLPRKRLAALKPSRQITPRNVRSLVLRYQLARNLINTGSGAPPGKRRPNR